MKVDEWAVECEDQETHAMSIDKKLKVFLIEDAGKIRATLIELLQQTGRIEVVGYAESEREALDQLRSTDWDAAIVDIGLREGSGLGVLAGLKRDARTYGKRFVFTNSPSVALQLRSIALGADGFFDKSRDLESLVDRLQALLC
jgi:two-component system OmpR family response regulator